MTKAEDTQYWLFQSNPKWLQLPSALRSESLHAFPVRAHKNKIKKGDKVILWQTGKESGCYGLATVTSAVQEGEPPEPEQSLVYLDDWQRYVSLQVDYNLWDRPIAGAETVKRLKTFDRFYAGLPGVNYKASEEQYDTLIELVRQSEVANEPREEYVAQPPARRALNTLFYGPPGTGKTYHTLNYALSIIEGRSLEELALEDRQVLRRRFEEYKEEGQVHFVSFHQSYTYEDFIEGIKPRSEKGKVSYVVEDGIFKIAAMEARRSLVEAILRNMPQEVIAVDYGQLYKSFLEYLRTDEFNTFITPKGRKVFLHKILKFGHISVRPDKSFSVVNISKNRLRKMYKAFHGPELPPDLDQALRNLLGNVNTSAYWSVFGELKKFEAQYLQSLANQSAEDELEEEELEVVDLEQVTEQVIQICCKHVLIIDEINRGNIASIFGELITLVDEDKREGAPEEVSVILPYSKSVFSVPPNLYIIGTMNTADRSIETMDLAMRRRFTFVEMPPRPELIASLAAAPNLSGIDLSRMLEVINQRISVLLDKDYQIGHSYFLDIQNFRALRQLFAEKILPLLQEYFFSDLAKIGLVLGNGFIQKERPVSDNIFADFDHAYANELAEKHVYKLRPVAELSEADFIRIYDPTF